MISHDKCRLYFQFSGTHLKTDATRKALMRAEGFGIRGVAELFLVAEAASRVVTVLTSGAMVVPGTVVTASATADPTVLPPVVVMADMVVETTEGEIVVPAIVVVYVIS